MTIFFRLGAARDKEEALQTAVADLKSSTVFMVEVEGFRAISGSPFCYWVSHQSLGLFQRLRPFESCGRTALGGLKTLDDRRFLRAWWEVAFRGERKGRTWVPLAKGGASSTFYADVQLLVNWSAEGGEISWYGYQRRPREGFGATNRGIGAYFRPGLTWPRRADRLGFRVMPSGCIFADKSPAAFVPNDETRSLLALCGILNSSTFRALLALRLARTELAQSYEVGLVQQTPVPHVTKEVESALSARVLRAWRLKRFLDACVETSHAFALPALLQVDGARLADRIAAWLGRVREIRGELASIQADLNDRCFVLYEMDEKDRPGLTLGTEPAEATSELETASAQDRAGRGEEEPEAEGAALISGLVSWAVGVAMGRFDIRLATGARKASEQVDPSAPLPGYSPGMFPEGVMPRAYALRVPQDGILVDDEGHDWNVVGRVRDVLHVVFDDQAEAVEHEACQILGVASLRDYLVRVGARGFWDDHVRRYSTRTRRAPVYWLLCSPKGLYSAWVYCHRLDRDILHRLLGAEYLGGRMQRVRQAIEELRSGGAEEARDHEKGGAPALRP